MEENNVVADNSNTAEEEVLETSNEEQESEQDTTDWKAKALKAEELANNQRIRAEKAEKLAKQKQGETSKQVATGLDDATIAKIYGIHEDDFPEVKDMASFKKISIAEALKLSATKAILAEKAEFRKTAEVSNTGNTRRGATAVSEDTLLQNLSEGKVPEKGSKEAEDLFWAKRGGKK